MSVGFAGRIVGVLNDTRLPNWVWFVVGTLATGFIVGVQYGQGVTTKDDLKEQAAIYEARDVERTADLERQIKALDSKLDRRTNRINEELTALGQATRVLIRKVD